VTSRRPVPPPPPPVVDVAAPQLEPGDDLRNEGDFGALTLFLALAARLDPVEAVFATDRWAGDRYGDLEGALRDWVTAGPTEAAASVTTSAGITTLRTCDPGDGILSAPAVSSADVLVYPALRAYLWAAYRPEGIEPAVVECMATALLTGLPVEVLSDPDPPEDDLAEVQALVFRSMSECQRSR
jgi:hypothetical protein